MKHFLFLLVSAGLLLFLSSCNMTNFGSSSGKKPGGYNATGDSPESSDAKKTDPGDGNDGDDGNGSDSTDGSDSGGEGGGDDGDDDGDDDKKKDPTGLTITSLERDDDTQLVIKTLDGKTVTVNFPEEGKTLIVPNVCNVGKPTKLEMQAISEDGATRELSEAQCFLGKRKDEKSVFIGFEDDCNSLKASKIDEEIGLYSCPDSELEVPGLRMDNAIDVDDWD